MALGLRWALLAWALWLVPAWSIGTVPDVTAVATGRTNGEIAVATFHNRTERPVSLGEGLYRVSAGPRYQDFLVRLPTVTVAPRSRRTVRLTGYCLSAAKPTPPAGTSLGALPDWRAVRPLSPEAALRRLPRGDARAPLRIPGTDAPLDAAAVRDPALRADLAASVLQAATAALRRPKLRAAVETPYPRGGAEEDRIVIQHLLWRVMGEVDGTPYDREAFTRKMREAAAEVSDDEASATQEAAEGADAIWASVSLVGAEAKVLRPTERSTEGGAT